MSRRSIITLIDNFIAELHAEKGLSQSSLKKYVVLVRKVLKEAERDGTIDHIPTLPTIKRTENPRPWFSPEQYAVLLETCRSLRDNPPERTEFDFGELYDFIVFMVHSFLRPSEWKLLQNKHIRVFSDDGIDQLVISVPNSKTKNAKGSIDSTTTEVAADLYVGRSCLAMMAGTTICSLMTSRTGPMRATGFQRCSSTWLRRRD